MSFRSGYFFLNFPRFSWSAKVCHFTFFIFLFHNYSSKKLFFQSIELFFHLIVSLASCSHWLLLLLFSFLLFFFWFSLFFIIFSLDSSSSAVFQLDSVKTPSSFLGFALTGLVKDQILLAAEVLQWPLHFEILYDPTIRAASLS